MPKLKGATVFCEGDSTHSPFVKARTVKAAIETWNCAVEEKLARKRELEQIHIMELEHD
jgi:hypothetical protein